MSSFHAHCKCLNVALTDTSFLDIKVRKSVCMLQLSNQNPVVINKKNFLHNLQIISNVKPQKPCTWHVSDTPEACKNVIELCHAQKMKSKQLILMYVKPWSKLYGQTPSEIEIIQLQRHSYDNYILNHWWTIWHCNTNYWLTISEVHKIKNTS